VKLHAVGAFDPAYLLITSNCRNLNVLLCTRTRIVCTLVTYAPFRRFGQQLLGGTGVLKTVMRCISGLGDITGSHSLAIARVISW
jgi:hypothetical protein